MVIQHNIAAQNAGRYLKTNTGKLSKSLEKLSSGYTINRAGDNAAGLAVSEKMRAQIAGLDQSVNNAQDGISMIQTYEGALTESHNILMRMKHLSAQSANGTYTDETDRAAIELEYEQLAEELDDIADTDFNNIKMLDGSAGLTPLFNTGNETAETIAARLKEIEAAIAPLTGIGALSVSDAANTLSILPGVRSDLQGILDNMPDNDATAAARRMLTDSMSMLGFIENRAKGVADGSITDSGEISFADYAVKAFVSRIGSLADLTAGITGTDTNLLKALSDAKSIVSAIEASEADGTLTIAPTDSRKLGIPKASIISVVGSGKTSTISPLLDKVETAYSLLQEQTAKLSVIRDNVKDKTETARMLDTAIEATNKQSELVLKIHGTLMTVLENPNVDKDEATNKIYAKQVDTYLTEIDNISKTTEYKGAMLLDGTFVNEPLKYEDFGSEPTGVSLQVGARSKDLKNYNFDYSSVWGGNSDLQKQSIGDLTANINATAAGLGLDTDKVNLASQKNANKALDKIDNAINKVSMIRGTFGAIQNRLEHKVTNLNNTMENLTAAESRIRDTDMAAEMMNFTKEQIVMQASQSMLAQANQLPTATLQLLQ
jgi:flagellin